MNELLIAVALGAIVLYPDGNAGRRKALVRVPAESETEDNNNR